MNILQENNKPDWKIWLQIALTVITAVASALGITSCVGKIW